MKINFTYKKNLVLSPKKKNFLTNESGTFGEVTIKTYTSRFGTLDLVSLIETGLTFIALTNLQAYIKGFTGEDWFKKLGGNSRKEIENEIKTARNFIKAFYQVFVKHNDNFEEAYVLKESIGDITLYAVINHVGISDKLLNELPRAFVHAYGLICLEHVNVESKTCQLYPDFKTKEWRYLFMPTYNAFGKYVDKYYDFKLKKVIEINSKEEFISKFNLSNADKYKLIINAQLER